MSESKNYSNQNQHFLEKKIGKYRREANTKRDRCAGPIQVQQESQEEATLWGDGTPEKDNENFSNSA